MKEQTRRDLLKRGISVAAGAVGVSAGLASATDTQAALTLTLRGTGVRARVHGSSRGRMPKPDDHVTIHGHLTDGLDAGGTFGSTGVAIRLPDSDEITLLEQHLFATPSGILTGAGQRTGETGTFAITGGTGRFTGASGSYTAQLSPRGLGGDGTARFDLVLAIQEG
jgi:hypothetical protein